MTQNRDALPCEDHKKAFYGTCGFFVLVLTILISGVIDNDRRAQRADAAIIQDLSEAKIKAQEEHQNMMEKFSERMEKTNVEIVQRLARIEAKIEGATNANPRYSPQANKGQPVNTSH